MLCFFLVKLSQLILLENVWRSVRRIGMWILWLKIQWLREHFFKSNMVITCSLPGGGGGGGTQIVLYWEALPLGPTPYPFIYHFWQKRNPIDKWYPFHIPNRCKCTVFNPLSPNSDQDQFSPNNIYTLSTDKLWELIKWSPKQKCLDLLTNSLNSFFKEMYGDQFGEFICGYWGLKG